MSDLVAMPQRERSALALLKREREKWENDYIVYLRSIAREKCALQINSEMSDAEIAELDELVAAKASFAAKHPRLVFAGLLAIFLSSGAVMPIYPPALLGFCAGFAGVIWSVIFMNWDFSGFFTARKRLQKLCGKNFLPYDAVRKAAADS